MNSNNLKAQIIFDNSEFNFTSNQELWRHVIWLQYYETSVSTIFDYRVQNSKHPYEHVIELSFKRKVSKFATQQIYNIPLIQKGIRIEIYFFMGLELQ